MRRGGSRAYKQSITIPNVGCLLYLSRNLTGLYRLLSFYPARKGRGALGVVCVCIGGGLSLSVPVQSGQRGRDQST